MTASDITQSVRISEVWSALGGGKIRHGRAQAFWRNGDGWTVSLNGDRGFWYDFRDGVGGGVIDLVVHVAGGNRSDALRWIADMIGATLDDRPSPTRQALADAAKIAADAIYFADAAIVMAEGQLENLADNNAERAEWTQLIGALRKSPEAEYRAWWRNGNAATAAALARAGRERSRRLQQMLAGFLTAEVFDVAA